MAKRRDEFVILVGGTFKSGPMGAETALVEAMHFCRDATLYRLVEVPLAEVEAQAKRERKARGKRKGSKR